MKVKRILILSVLFLAMGCSKDKDFLIPDSLDPDPDAGAEVQDFMWKSMNYWYFWQANVPDLADDRFSTSEDYTDFLLSEAEPGSFFDNKLLHSEDRFSIYRENYRDLVNLLSGVAKSNGLEFGLVRFADSQDVLGYVRYIIPGSDAATKDIARGDIFTGVDGQTLTTTNYVNLLFGNNDSYTLNMADIAGGQVTPNNKEVSLTKQEGLAENPIFLSMTYEIGGSKIGYLVYNGFYEQFDEQLNDVFANFKSEGVTDVVIDLRYNSGGSVNTSRLLGGMIYTDDSKNIFLRKRYNQKVQDLYSSDLNFTNKTPNGSTVASLGLERVYVLTTQSTASASELLVNCLDPYMDVVQIGETTRGKNEFSTTLVDDRDYSYIYNPARVNNINPKVQWGLQPLIGRNENVDGFYDYTSGLVPDIALPEDLENMGVLGDLNEPLLARAIQEITGSSGKRDFTVKTPAIPFTSPKMQDPLRNQMFDNQALVPPTGPEP